MTQETERTPQRQALADAITHRDACQQALEAGGRAVERAGDALAAAEARLEAAQAAIEESRALRAQELAHAVEAAEAVTAIPASPTRKARIDEADAEDDLDAARVALAGLQGRLGDAKDDLHAAENTVVALADAVIRSVGQRILAEACEAAMRFQRARMLMHFLLAPERAGQPVIMGWQRPVFGEDWTDSVRAFGQERANRRARAADAAMRARDEGFAGETADAIQRHLDRALEAIHRTDQKWREAPELAPWQEARAAMLDGDADSPLPPI